MHEVVIQHISAAPQASAYINSVPVGRYASLCGISDITIRLEKKAEFKVVYRYCDGKSSESTYDTDNLNLKTEGIKMITILPARGDVMPPGCVLAQAESENDIDLVHVICSYHRESLIESTLNSFADFECPGYRMVVIDNGMTLESVSDRVTVIDSANMGGSSGFTRGMLYAIDTGATHVVLNDDDARVEPESMFRLMAFLRLLKNPSLCVAGILSISLTSSPLWSGTR